MRASYILGIIIIFCSHVSLAGEQYEWSNFMLNSPGMALKMNAINASENMPMSMQLETATGMAGKKSVGKAVLFSALLPGAGEFYAGCYYKAAAFITVEAISWLAYFNYKDKGQEIEDEFHNYADTHWRENIYWDWVYHLGVKNGANVTKGDLVSLREYERGRFSHGLHIDKDQQYYEMIGKYDQFNAGWDDSRYDMANPEEYFQKYDPFSARDYSLRTENRLFYETRRDESNKNFKNATTSATIALLNHVLSAADAALTVHFQNRKLDLALRLNRLNFCQDAQPVVTLFLTW